MALRFVSEWTVDEYWSKNVCQLRIFPSKGFIISFGKLGLAASFKLFEGKGDEATSGFGTLLVLADSKS